MNSEEKIFPWLLANFSEFFAGVEFKEKLKLATRESYERYEFLKLRTCRNYAIGGQIFSSIDLTINILTSQVRLQFVIFIS